MEKQQKKKTIIITIWVVIFLLIGFGVYSLIPRQTCFDGIQNQNEEGVDCGGVCAKACHKIEAQDMIVEKTGVVPSGIDGKYDFYAQINNPNAVFGSQKFDYTVTLSDASGNIVAQRSGSSFILPGERKYVVESNIDSAMPASSSMKIDNSDWVEFNDYYSKPDLKIVSRVYNEVTSGAGFGEAKGLLENDSPYDFDTIKIIVALKNESGDVIALNSTQMKTVLSGESREFTVNWPNRFPGVVADMEAQADVNIFGSDAFMQRTYQTRTFQQY